VGAVAEGDADETAALVVGTAVPGPGVAVEQPEADSVIAARVTPRGRNFFTGTAFLR